MSCLHLTSTSVHGHRKPWMSRVSESHMVVQISSICLSHPLIFSLGALFGGATRPVLCFRTVAVELESSQVAFSCLTSLYECSCLVVESATLCVVCNNWPYEKLYPKLHEIGVSTRFWLQCGEAPWSQCSIQTIAFISVSICGKNWMWKYVAFTSLNLVLCGFERKKKKRTQL